MATIEGGQQSMLSMAEWQDWTERIGHKVVFHDPVGPDEEGVVSSVNDNFVFVRFGNSIGGVACHPWQLTPVAL